jgi:hypothetical protein
MPGHREADHPDWFGAIHDVLLFYSKTNDYYFSRPSART